MVEKNELEKAIIYFNKAIEINPIEPMFDMNKGFALEKLKKQNEANKCFDNAIKLCPKMIDSINKNKGK